MLPLVVWNFFRISQSMFHPIFRQFCKHYFPVCCGEYTWQFRRSMLNCIVKWTNGLSLTSYRGAFSLEMLVDKGLEKSAIQWNLVSIQRKSFATATVNPNADIQIYGLTLNGFCLLENLQLQNYKHYPVWLGRLTHVLRETQSHWPPFCFHSQLCKNDTRATTKKLECREIETSISSAYEN